MSGICCPRPTREDHRIGAVLAFINTGSVTGAEIALAFVYLAPEDARFVVGEVLGITGRGQATRSHGKAPRETK